MSHLRHPQPRRLAPGGLGAVLRGPSRTGIQRIEREDEPRRVSLKVMLRGTCERARLLDLVENFTLFSEHKAGLAKIIGQNHQFLGVNNAIASLLEARS
jgi:type I site-specific restriction-modification system R (restriction) subunit